MLWDFITRLFSVCLSCRAGVVCGYATALAWLDTEGKTWQPGSPAGNTKTAEGDKTRMRENVAKLGEYGRFFLCSPSHLIIVHSIIFSWTAWSSTEWSDCGTARSFRKNRVETRPRRNFWSFLDHSITAAFHRSLLHHYLSLFSSLS